MNLIDLLENNQQKDLFSSNKTSIKILKQHWKTAKENNWALANVDFSKGKFVYLAQKITGYKTRPLQRNYWLNTFKGLNATYNSKVNDKKQVTLIDPWDFNFSRLVGVDIGTLEPCIDYALVSHSSLVIMDFAREVSFGTTCEILCANTRKVPVVGVKKIDQQLSIFTQKHTSLILDEDNMLQHLAQRSIQDKPEDWVRLLLKGTK